ncbi:hypothetical protein [Devosia sp. RR2S18]|uniref:hypothetical protein n=1 Tax=Devosia rhizosphaerae TaxID=3049774 RepID=UPI0025418ECD|nr:hypothetical protein [Devosia sp. RR2S18]WIJ24611.1 hypothetical protein QOV41_16570 [Devosia sp. RR2S18]
MAQAAGRPNILLISNGHGEDWIASAIAARLKDHADVEAYPMIGAGYAYSDACPIVGPRASLASEGWRNVKGSLRRDIATGGLGIIPPALRFLRAVRGRYDRVVVVGDMVGVLACLATGYRDLVYLDVYKTGAARLYSRAERWAIRQTCRTVFCRNPRLAQLLQQDGVDARAAGNVMMDAISSGPYDAAARRTRPLAVTLLPGARALTSESFELQVAALRTLSEDMLPDIFMAVAGSANIENMAKRTGLRRVPMLSHEPADLGQLADDRLTIHMARGNALGNVLAASDLVLSQAGTATIQALGLGKPAITFINPRDRRSRFEDEQALFGDARIVVQPEAGEIGAALKKLLDDSAHRERLSQSGRDRIGGPGAMQAILAVLLGP